MVRGIRAHLNLSQTQMHYCGRRTVRPTWCLVKYREWEDTSELLVLMDRPGKGEPLVGNVNTTGLEELAGCTGLAKASALGGRLVRCAAAQGSSDRGRPAVMRACGRPLSRCIAFTCEPNAVKRSAWR